MQSEVSLRNISTIMHHLTTGNTLENASLGGPIVMQTTWSIHTSDGPTYDAPRLYGPANFKYFYFFPLYSIFLFFFSIKN